MKVKHEKTMDITRTMGHRSDHMRSHGKVSITWRISTCSKVEEKKWGSIRNTCIVTDSRGRGVPACYTRVIMGPDPHVISIISGDTLQYGGPLYAVPDHNQGEHPRYVQDDLWWFKFGADDFDWFESALEPISDLSLTAEVMRYREASRLFFQYQEEIRKIEVRLWEASQHKDASGRRLEGANTLHRIEEALVDLDHRSRVRHGNTRHWEHGHSTWKGGDVMGRRVDTYYMVMTNVSK